jgi:hypothetical protein
VRFIHHHGTDQCGYGHDLTALLVLAKLASIRGIVCVLLFLLSHSVSRIVFSCVFAPVLLTTSTDLFLDNGDLSR